MTLIFKISVIVNCFGAKVGGGESLNFDLGVFNFDTMKFILFAKVLKILVPSHF